MEPKPTLKLNRQTGKYELTIGIDADSMKRRLFAYALQEHLDPFNDDEWQRAKEHIARLEEWQDHPHAEIVTPAIQPVWAVEAAKPTPPPVEQTVEAETPFSGYLSRGELRAKALELPVDQWETLLTPYPEDADQSLRNRLSVRRSKERKVLKDLERETFPDTLDLEKLHAVAHVVNSNGIH